MASKPPKTSSVRELSCCWGQSRPCAALAFPFTLNVMFCTRFRLPQKGRILISHKKWAAHIIVTIFSFHSLSDIKKNKWKKEESIGSLQGMKKKHHFISVWGFCLIPVCSHNPACKKIFVWYKGHWIIYAIFNNAVNQGEFSKADMALCIICLARLAFPNKPPPSNTISTCNITKKKIEILPNLEIKQSICY